MYVFHFHPIRAAATMALDGVSSASRTTTSATLAATKTRATVPLGMEDSNNSVAIDLVRQA